MKRTTLRQTHFSSALFHVPFKIDQKLNFEEQTFPAKTTSGSHFLCETKRCALTRINVPNFCYFYKKNTMFSGWIMQKLRDFHTNQIWTFFLPTEHIIFFKQQKFGTSNLNVFCAYFWFPIFLLILMFTFGLY